MREILGDLQDIIDASDYDGGEDDDIEESIDNLKNDFYTTLSGELKKLEPPE